MAEKSVKEFVLERYSEAEAKLAELNAALRANDAAKMAKNESELKDIESSYRAVKTKQVFGECATLKDAIVRHDFPIIGHKAIKSEGTITGFEMVSDKICQIDLVEYCKYMQLDATWRFKVEKLNQLLAMRAGREIGMTNAQITKMHDSFHMNELARKLDMGETPDSNTAICKVLQQVLDSILFEDDGKGKNLNRYKCNSHDVAYLLMCYTKRGKEVLSVSVAKNAYIHRLIADILHRTVTGKVYNLDYQMVENKSKTSPITITSSEPEAKENVVDKASEVKVPKAKHAKKPA